MAKFFGNLHLVLAVGLLLAIAVMMQFGLSAPVDVNSVTHYVLELSARDGEMNFATVARQFGGSIEVMG